MKRIIILIMVFSVLFCACAKEENKENVSDNVVTESPVPGDVAEIDYAANSNNYWRDELRRQKKDIDTIVNWLKGIDYCDSISFRPSGLSTLPDDEETRKKIQNESNYETIKEIITRNEYSIRNHWFSDRRIIILHQFDIGEIHGNYCLVYAEGKMEESEKNYYKIVDKNYYSEVIFYE